VTRHPTSSHRLLCAALFLLPLTAAAQTAQTAPIDAPGVSATATLQMLLGLGLVLALFFGGAYLLRRLNGGKNFGRTGPLKILGGLMIGPRERIVLVEIGETWLVVGVVPGQIKTLHTLPKGELPKEGDDEKPFAFWLKQITGNIHEKQ
jgi:flagellar protein FliO/FliZ